MYVNDWRTKKFALNICMRRKIYKNGRFVVVLLISKFSKNISFQQVSQKKGFLFQHLYNRSKANRYSPTLRPTTDSSAS